MAAVGGVAEGHLSLRSIFNVAPLYEPEPELEFDAIPEEDVPTPLDIFLLSTDQSLHWCPVLSLSWWLLLAPVFVLEFWAF